jgi:MFS family permease
MAYLAAIAGFFGNAGVSGLYSIAAYAFPTHVRATGTGFVIGVGRGGAVLAPILAGYLLDTGFSLPTLGMVMGAGSLCGAITLMFVKLDDQREASVARVH